MDTYSSARAASAAGCSYRMLDYWVRQGIIRPSVFDAVGSGTCRRWDLYDVTALRVVRVLSSLGATGTVLREVVGALRDDPGLWESSVLVTADGLVLRFDEALIRSRTPGWWINLEHEWKAALQQLGASKRRGGVARLSRSR